MSREANVYKWLGCGALIGLIIGLLNANYDLLNSLRSYGITFPDFGYFYSISGGAIVAAFAAIIFNWWRRQR